MVSSKSLSQLFNTEYTKLVNLFNETLQHRKKYLLGLINEFLLERAPVDLTEEVENRFESHMRVFAPTTPLYRILSVENTFQVRNQYEADDTEFELIDLSLSNENVALDSDKILKNKILTKNQLKVLEEQLWEQAKRFREKLSQKIIPTAHDAQLKIHRELLELLQSVQTSEVIDNELIIKMFVKKLYVDEFDIKSETNIEPVNQETVTIMTEKAQCRLEEKNILGGLAKTASDKMHEIRIGITDYNPENITKEIDEIERKIFTQLSIVLIEINLSAYDTLNDLLHALLSEKLPKYIETLNKKKAAFSTKKEIIAAKLTLKEIRPNLTPEIISQAKILRPKLTGKLNNLVGIYRNALKMRTDEELRQRIELMAYVAGILPNITSEMDMTQLHEMNKRYEKIAVNHLNTLKEHIHLADEMIKLEEKSEKTKKRKWGKLS